MYGFPCLTETASLIEQAAREGQNEELLAELIEEFAALCHRAQATVKEQPPVTSKKTRRRIS
jgi:hypothetical protein